MNHLAHGDLDGALVEFLAVWRPRLRGPRWVPDVVPRPLRRVYELTDAARLATQNRLVAADALVVGAHGKLMFYVENQGVCRWATEEGDDPPVWIAWDWSDAVASWQPEAARLSEFVLQLAILEAAFSSDHCRIEMLDRDDGIELERSLIELPLPPWSWPVTPSRFFANERVIAFSSQADPTSLLVAARDQGALDAFLAPWADRFL